MFNEAHNRSKEHIKNKINTLQGTFLKTKLKSFIFEVHNY